MKHTRARAVTASFSYMDDAETRRLLSLADELADKDSRSRSWVIMEALKEYMANHYPGNPQTDMRVYMGQIEGPKTLRQSKQPRKIDPRDIDWLMLSRKWTKEQALEHLTQAGYVA